jgi:hypothetical protein
MNGGNGKCVVYVTLVRKLQLKMPHRRPERRYEYNINIDFREMRLSGGLL